MNGVKTLNKIFTEQVPKIYFTSLSYSHYIFEGNLWWTFQLSN